MLPTLNEEKAIGQVIQEIKNCGYRNILVVDGYSKDRTVEIAKSLGVKVIYQVGHGKASAIKTGLEEIKTPYVAIMDGDGTYDPCDIEKLLKVAIEHGYDEVIGYREKRGNIPLLHRIGNRIISTVLTLLMGQRIKDPCSGMYLLKTNTAKNLELTATDFDIEVEITIQIISLGKTGEVPINYKKRIGERKLKTWSAGFRILLTTLKITWLYNPVLLFSTTASIFGAIGLSILLWQLYLRYIHGEEKWSWGWAWLGLTLLIIGLQAFTLTIISLLLKRIERRIIQTMKQKQLQTTKTHENHK